MSAIARDGSWGALAATAGFIIPSLLLVLGLSWAYEQYGATGGVRDLVVGLDAIVVGVIASVALDFAAEHARGKVQATLAVGAFAVAVTGASLLWAVLGALIVGALLLPPVPEPTAGTEPAAARVSRRRLALSLAPATVVAAAAIIAALSPGALAAVTADMAKIGAVAFGNGTTILPVLQQDVVNVHHWLSPQAFGAGIAVGQATPGPSLITAAFVGFQAAGWWGGTPRSRRDLRTERRDDRDRRRDLPTAPQARLGARSDAGDHGGVRRTPRQRRPHPGRPDPGVPAALGGRPPGRYLPARAFKWYVLLVFGVGIAAWGIYLAFGGAVRT